MVMGEASGVADSEDCLLPQPTTARAKLKDRSATKAKATNLRILVFHLLLIQPPPGYLPRRVTGSVTDQTQKHHSRAVLIWQRPRCVAEVSLPGDPPRHPRGEGKPRGRLGGPGPICQ